MTTTATTFLDHPGCRLWIDGVGSWLVWFRNEFIVGNASSRGEPHAKHLGLQADLRTRHATFERRGEEYRILPHGPVRVNESEVGLETLLRDRDQLTLGEEVGWRFLVPSPLSRSAVLRFESSHRPSPRIDGVVLFSQTCLLGPNRQTHIPCPDWEESAVLFVRDGGLWMKTDGRTGVRSQESAVSRDEPRLIADGDVLGGDDWRFRVEMVV